MKQVLTCAMISVIALVTLSAPSQARYDGDAGKLTSDERSKMKLDPDELLNLSLRFLEDGYDHRDLQPEWVVSTVNSRSAQLKTDADFEQAFKEIVESLNDARIRLTRLDQLKKPANKGLIGMQLIITRNGETTITSCLRMMPAQLAGLKAGDTIVAIDGKPAPRDLTDCISLISGQPGTQVQIKFRRDGQLLQTTLTRSDRKPPDEVICKLIGNIAYLRPSFNSDHEHWQYTKDAISGLSSTGAKGLVLDVRDMTASAAPDEGTLAGLFVPNGTLRVSAKSASKSITSKTDQEPLLSSLPMVVLINRGTSYTTEPNVDCLKYHKRAELVGERTFGYGWYTSTSRLDKDYELTYPHEEGFTLDGSPIDLGVSPNVVVAAKDCAADEGPWYANNTPGAAPSPDVMNKSGQIADKQLRVGISTLQRKIAESK